MKAPRISSIVTVVAMTWISALPSAQAQNSGETVAVIRQRYATINQNLTKYRTVKKELEGFSTEGGELTAYTEGRAIRKIVARFQGESGRALEEYYYWDDKLQFVYRKEDTYSEPMSGKVTSSVETRSYFENGELIRWLNGEAKPMRRGSDPFREHETRCLRNSEIFVTGARSTTATIKAPE